MQAPPLRKLRPDELGRPAADAVAALPRHPVAALLDRVRSLYNVGAMFRTADALALDHLYLTGYTGTPAHPSLRKTALGAETTVPWSHHADPLALADQLRAEGHTLVALELTDRPTPAADLPLGVFPLVLVVGNEVDGIEDALLARCDAAVELPQYGAKHSLNAATAFGVAAYDLVRHYRRLAAAPALP